MNMKQHILAALREEFEPWEELLGSMSEKQLVAPLAPSQWSVKDEVAHLRTWQQRSIARVQAAQLGGEPEFPKFPEGLDPDAEESTEKINAWIYESNRELPWITCIEIGEKDSCDFSNWEMRSQRWSC